VQRRTWQGRRDGCRCMPGTTGSARAPGGAACAADRTSTNTNGRPSSAGLSRLNSASEEKMRAGEKSDAGAMNAYTVNAATEARIGDAVISATVPV